MNDPLTQAGMTTDQILQEYSKKQASSKVMADPNAKTDDILNAYFSGSHDTPMTAASPLPPITVSGNPTWDNFTQQAAHIAKKRQYPLNVLLGQAALESARGSAAPGNNYFGIKAPGSAGTNNLATQEYGAGGYYGENSDFGAYQSPEDSINSYIDLITTNPIYAPAWRQYQLDKNPSNLITNIHASGYATSPNYAQNVANTPEFQQYSGY